MPDARNGFISGIVGVFNGLILYYVLKGFVDAGLLSPLWLTVYDLLNVLAILVFVHSTPYWGTGYLFGWWFGFGVMWYSGLVGSLEFGVYSFVLIIVLISRIARRIDNYF
jgi:hypothetical protein